jgi:hypothetical protein
LTLETPYSQIRDNAEVPGAILSGILPEIPREISTSMDTELFYQLMLQCLKKE